MDKKVEKLIHLVGIVISLVVISYLFFSFADIKAAEIVLPVLLVFGVILLILALSFVALIFSVLNLSDRSQSLVYPKEAFDP